MQGGDKQQPRLAERGERRADERQMRLAKALRDNLGRRKAQQRARAADAPACPAPDGAARSTDG